MLTKYNKRDIYYFNIYSNRFAIILFLVLLFVLQLVTCPYWGQVVQKKQLTPSDYHLWGEVKLNKISFDEKWASYSMSYEDGRDTLFVRHISTNKTYPFAKGDNSVFTGSNHFICKSPEGMQILNLKTAEQKSISGVKLFSYCPQTDQLIYLIESDTDKKKLIIASLNGGKIKSISNVNHFLLSPNGTRLIYSTLSNAKNILWLMDLKKTNSPKSLASDSTNQFSFLTWQKDARSLAFCKQTVDRRINSLFYYTIENDKLYEFNPLTRSEFPDSTSIVSGAFNKILISDDLQKVFFSVQKKKNLSKSENHSGVEVWNTADKWTYIQEEKSGNFQNKPKIALWRPESDRFDIITTNELPNIILTSDLEHALLSNPKAYEPQFEYNGPRDFYIVDLKTFKKDMLLEKHPYTLIALNASPNGNYFAYFKENNWWVYNIAQNKHTNITGISQGKFTEKKESLVPESISGNPGWSLSDKEILLYDQYDIWAFTPDGKTFKRLTHGRETKIKYRIADPPNKTGEKHSYDGFVIPSVDLSKTLLLRAEGEDGKTGYFKWDAVNGEKPIIYTDSYIDQLNYSSKKNSFFFREQRFDMPPRLLVQKNTEQSTVFFNSNTHQQKYYWGKSELITYENSKGKKLKGVLFYPADYNPTKKYPMIVKVYETQSKELHVYDNPTHYNSNGFNISILTAENYFIFLPDILLEEKNPGFSAADCAIAGTKKIIDLGIIDPSKIGIMGHSFGGFESLFTITQTQLFSAAIGSGAITDLNSYYHTVNQNTGQPDIWRFESEEWNMQGPPSENQQEYLSNSPITHIGNIKTPVLLWTGKEDWQVDSRQSTEFYTALRRLRKKGIMLLYPNEGHLLIKPENQKNTTQKILEWFDYFLKGKKGIKWIENTIE
ncbi:prolyl oligopeptidase family serine peptidase [Flavobacterium sp. FlaQc-57]|uniref:S9 family peptidase n=1 Tax=Flavobacterium sp. FlaQc-57 TaxID=3374186 RepID=UPI003758387B